MSGTKPPLGTEGKSGALIRLEDLSKVFFADEVETYLHAGVPAVSVAVALGRSSIRFIEITEGLNEGDQVIISDPSLQARDAPRVRLR